MRLLGIAILASAAAAACSLPPFPPEGTGGTSGASGDHCVIDSDCVSGLVCNNGVCGPSSPCPGSGGPAMVRLPEGYCIDSTEVTRAQYEEWVSTSPSSRGQIVKCLSNTTFAPDVSCMGSSSVCQSGCDNHPQVCVNWCDAYAYCLAVGKRLCGKIGGGPNGYNDYASVALSQWYNACTSHGAHIFPYGNTYDGQACNGGDHGVGTTVAVGSMSTCQSPEAAYSGVYDLSGNVSEWTDECTGDAVTTPLNCRHGGGALWADGALDCALGWTSTQVGLGGPMIPVPQPTVGFRCCSP